MASDIDLAKNFSFEDVSSRSSKEEKKDNTGLIVGGIIGGLFLVGGATALALGGKKKKSLKPPDQTPPNNPPPDNNPEVPPDNPPDNPPPDEAPDELQFDLKNNWGGVPEEWRARFAKLELAAKIPGIARVGAVKAWQAYSAKQPYVTTAEAAKRWADNPDLNTNAINKGDGPDAKAGLDGGIKQGFPKPKDYDGWAEGSFGLFDILGSNIAFAGVHTDPASALPFINEDSAEEAAANITVQFGAFAYMIWRILNAPGYKVTVPGPNAANGDSLQTWTNIMSAYSNPTEYQKKSASAMAAKKAFGERAVELGIDLAKIAYPWPPGSKYDKKDWKFSAVWARLVSYTDVPVVDNGAPPMFLPNPPLQENLVDLGNGIRARLLSQIAPEAPAPLLILLHGRDANEQQLLSLVSANVKGVRMAFLRGPKGSAPKFRWFDPPLLGPLMNLSNAVTTATAAVETAIANVKKLYPNTTNVAVLGFNQGGVIAYNLAARQQGVPAVNATIQYVVPIASWLPPQLRPTKGTPVIVHAIHGDADKALPLQRDSATIETFIFNAPGSDLTTVPGGTNALSTLQAQVVARLKG